MENGLSELRKMVIRELSRGEECAKQLQSSLHSLTSASSTQNMLVKEVVSSFDNVLTLLKSSDPGLEIPPAAVDSPRSMSCSPVSDDDSGRVFRDLERRDICRKRKALPKWIQQVCINPETGSEGSLDDGYSWRKYGQKDILGAKYPRGYYRCTHRHLQGCQATKQVQRSDNNPAVFDITYRGKHTCDQAAHLPSTLTHQEKQQKMQPQDHQPNLLMDYKSGLKVETQGLDDEPTIMAASFSFPSNPEHQQQQQQVHHQQPFDQLVGSGSPSFVSPATSDNYYMVSPRYGGMEMPRFNTSEADLTEIISATTSASNSPIVGMEFPLDNFDLDQHDLTFHLPGFF